MAAGSAGRAARRGRGRGADLVRAAGRGEVRGRPGAGDRAQRWALEADLLIAERERQRAAETVEVVLPAHLSVSQLVALQRDPQRLARRLRRPLPEAPDPYARRGTAFHLWLERRFGGGPLLDLDDLPGSSDAGAASDNELEELQKQFLDSEWADRVPARVEVPFATVVAGVVVRGRMDAVFVVPGQPDHFDVIDWKTGQRPTGADATAAAVQLAAYRLAWAELTGLPVDNVSAGFHYVRDADDGASGRPARRRRPRRAGGGSAGGRRGAAKSRRTAVASEVMSAPLPPPTPAGPRSRPAPSRVPGRTPRLRCRGRTRK